MWKHLVHPNIVRFRGAILGPPQLVSDWIPNRGLTGYVTVHPEKNRLELVGSILVVSDEVLTLCQLYDVAQGLDYLHKHDIAHGDIKGVCRCQEYHSDLLTDVSQTSSSTLLAVRISLALI